MLKLFLALLTLLLLNISVNSIMVVTKANKNKYCFTKHAVRTEQISFSFVTSSEDMEYVDVSLMDSHQNVLFQAKETEQGKFTGEVKESGYHTLCFFTLTKNEYYISFEFFTDEDKTNASILAKDTSLHNMKKEVSEMSRMLEEIERNLRFILDRRSVHHTAIIGMTNSIRHLSYVKIFVITLISLIQIVIIQKFFANSSKGKVSYGGSFEMGGL